MEKLAISKEIQMLRGMGIILVCAHHAIRNMETSFISQIILRITQADVVFFFIIAGFLFEYKFEKYKNSPIKFLKMKARQLLIPYAFWSLILYVGGCVCHNLIGGKISTLLTEFGFPPFTLKQTIIGFFTMKYCYVEHLWFLYVLFILFCIGIIGGYKLNRIAAIILLVGVRTVMSNYLDVPYLVDMTIKHLPDFLMGRILCENYKKNKWCVEKNKILIFLVVAIGSYLISMIFSNNTYVVGMLLNGYSNYIFRWCFVALSFFGANALVNNKKYKTLVLIGDYSFDIYLMHTPYVVPIAVIAMNRLGFPFVLELIVAVLCGIVIPVLVSKFFVRKFNILRRVMLGR